MCCHHQYLSSGHVLHNQGEAGRETLSGFLGLCFKKLDILSLGTGVGWLSTTAQLHSVSVRQQIPLPSEISGADDLQAPLFTTH